jgi:hypothetical protein
MAECLDKKVTAHQLQKHLSEHKCHERLIYIMNINLHI